MSEEPQADLECTKAMAESWREDYTKFRAKHGGKLKMLLLVRKDLGMGAGKIGAQCGHAAMGAITQYLVPWHELVMKPPHAVENPWDDDLRVYYAPNFGDSDDSDDEDDEYSAELASPSPAGMEIQIQTAVDAAASASAKSSAPSSAPSSPATQNVPEETPFSAPGDNQAHMNPIVESPTQAERDDQHLIQDQEDSEDPSTRYLRLTPKEIRRELYGTEAPIQAFMKLAIAEWVWKGQAKIALRANSDFELSELVKTLNNNGVPYFEVYDAGLTQIAANTRTVVAVGPFPADILDPLFQSLKLL